ncbi:MAG: hypothetical protein ABIF19_03280 [Planctomycetota bacterium]
MVGETAESNPSSGRKRLSQRRKQIYLQIIVGLVILFCGLVIGAGGALLHLKDKMVPFGPRPPLDAIVEDIQARYDLTPEQTKQVEAVFGAQRKTMQTLFDEFGQKVDAEFQKLNVEMKKILSPGQYERWERDFKNRRERGPGRHGPGRPGPGRPGPGRPGPGRPGPGGPGPEGRGFRGPGPEMPPPPEPDPAPE